MCKWKPDGPGRFVCRRCGRPTIPHIAFDKPPLRNCRASRGLGDTITKVTRAVGIKPCGGCKRRQKRLNELVPYGRE